MQNLQSLNTLNKSVQSLVDKTTRILSEVASLGSESISEKLEEIRQEAIKIAGNPLGDEQVQAMLQRIQEALESALEQIEQSGGGVDTEALKEEIKKILGALNTEELTEIIEAGKQELNALKSAGVSEVNARISYGANELNRIITENGGIPYKPKRKLFDSYSYAVGTGFAFWVELENEANEEGENVEYFKRIKYIGNSSALAGGVSKTGFENAGLVNTITIPENERCIEIHSNGADQIIALAEPKDSLYVMGRNSQGELGVGNKTQVTQMQRVYVGKKIKEVRMNTHGTFVLLENEDLYFSGNRHTSNFTKITDGVKHFWVDYNILLNDPYAYYALAVVKDDGQMYWWHIQHGASKFVTQESYKKAAPEGLKEVVVGGLGYNDVLLNRNGKMYGLTDNKLFDVAAKKWVQPYTNQGYGAYSLMLDINGNVYHNLDKQTGLSEVADIASTYTYSAAPYYTYVALKKDKTLWAKGYTLAVGGSATNATEWEQVESDVAQIAKVKGNIVWLKTDGEIYGGKPFTNNGIAKLTGN